MTIRSHRPRPAPVATVLALILCAVLIAGAPAPAAAQPATHERAALLAALGGNRAQVAAIQRDAAASRITATAGEILYLYNSLAPTREERLTGFELQAQETRDRALKTKCALAILEDEYYEINQLKGENKYNKFSKIFNRASSSLSKLALFQPQDAAQLLLDTAYGTRKNRPVTDRERRMDFLCGVFLAKHPDAPERAEVEELRQLLQPKLRGEMIERERLQGELREKRGDHIGAEFHFENASLLAPDNAELKQQLTNARAARAKASRDEELAVAVNPPRERISDSDRTALSRCARAMLTSDEAAFAAAARNPGAVADSIAYAAAAWFESIGNHTAAIQQLAATQATYPGTAGARASAALLANPRYNLDEQYDLAIEDLRNNRQKFILTGNRKTEDQGYMLSTAAIQTGGQGLAGIPALFVTDILVRGVAEHFKTQMETDLVVDTGARYIRRFGNSPRSREIASALADLCEKAGDADRAGRFLALSDTADPRATAGLREDKARKLVDRAATVSDMGQRRKLLDLVVNDYSDTKIAATARKELAALPPNAGVSALLLPPDVFKADPSLAAVLGLPDALVDGRRGNGEVADPGVVVDPDGGTLSYRPSRTQPYQVQELPSAGRDTVIARARAASDASDLRAAELEATRRQILPVEISGGAGGSGVSIAPRLIPVKDRPDESRLFSD